MKEIFLLHHTYGDSECESYKLLGVFSSEDKARFGILKYLDLPGLKSSPMGLL